MEVYTNKNLVSGAWEDYELLDSGDNKKLERFGTVVLIRPEPQALWKPLRPELWKRADATFSFREGKGSWKRSAGTPASWEITWKDVRALLKLTSFKHTGIFPEHAANWEWMQTCVNRLQQPRVLNIFGYTGMASVVAARHGAAVTHVDASKQSIAWAKENTRLSQVPEGSMRCIVDDALKFVQREVRRKSIYEGIVLDPPAFGRGAQGEVWKIEEQLPELMALLPKLLSHESGSFFLLNGYAAGYSAHSFMQLVQGFFPEQKGEFGELHLQESQSERRLSSGIYTRFISM